MTLCREFLACCYKSLLVLYYWNTDKLALEITLLTLFLSPLLC